jgi:pyrimidine deaminase RibD-like protein
LKTETDKNFMSRALELARKGAGLVSPNPMVGAVIVKDGRVVGEGFHRYDLLRHAEPQALEMAGDLTGGATLYCTLEPCCHHGRTPPCTDALIRAGIARAVIATSDPDRRVSDHGIQKLREAGITVEVGLCEHEALRLNESYFKFVKYHVPFFHAVEYWPEQTGPMSPWKPSKEFLDMAAQYDAISPGNQPETAAIILNACLNRFRHRPLVILGTPSALEQTRALLPAKLDKSKATLMELSSKSPPRLEALASSVLALPGFHAEVKNLLGAADKLTLISRGAGVEEAARLIKLDDVVSSESDGFREFTGYPKESEKID